VSIHLTTLDASGHTASTGALESSALSAPTERSLDGSLPRIAPPDEALEVARLAGWSAVVVFVFALASIPIVLSTGDPASAGAGVLQLVVVAALIYARRQVLQGRSQRGVIVLVVSILAAVLAMAPLPPPIPALAAAPIMAVAFALSYLDGRRLKAVLIVTWLVSVVTAVIVEFTPASPDLPVEFAVGLRIGTFAAVVGLVGLVLFRHRRRLEKAVTHAETASDALRDSEARYRTVVEEVREIIFQVDREGRWVLLNRAWEELTGHRVADAVGQSVMGFIHPDDRELSAALMQPVLESELKEYRHELRLVGSAATDVWVEAHARPIYDDAGRFSGISGTLTDITARRKLEERLVAQAFHDDLTGLANRALFKDRVEHALTRQLRGRRLVGLMFLDLDRFKTVNDSLGHTVGDGLLVAIAHRLHAALRPEDTIARLGGDEFGILVEDVSTPHGVLELAERISATFDTPFQLDDREITIRSSIGVVLASVGHRTADDLLRDADVAMYRAKVSGRGSYALFEPSMQAEVAARLELESDLREAITQERLTLAYQPIVDLEDGRIVGVEALSRWSHPVRGDVPPSVFIPSAEESGLILPLGAWVLRTACRDIARLRRSGGAATDLRLSVNLSPRQLGNRNIVDEVLGALRDAGLPPHVLDLEITESLVLDCGEEGLEYLRRLRAAGCGVSFDDFGTGFSSLGNLRSLPIDGLKIDISFVSAMLGGGVDAAVVEAVVRLGAALSVAVVAEGVEDAETAKRLAELGCPFAQGFYFGRPEPVAALAARLMGLAKVPAAA
jgi:diguanylate cyclase (GGDEF)-like protein/PAS domain S-box-containing protein